MLNGYNEVINNTWTYCKIAEELLNSGKVLIGWTDNEFDHRDILFVLNVTKIGECQRGIKSSYLYVSILHTGNVSSAFPIDEFSGDYIRKKLNLNNNSCDDSIICLVKGVLENIIKLRGGEEIE